MFTHRVRVTPKASSEVMIVVGKIRVFVRKDKERADILVAVDAPREVLIETFARFPPLRLAAVESPDHPMVAHLKPNRTILTLIRGEDQAMPPPMTGPPSMAGSR